MFTDCFRPLPTKNESSLEWLSDDDSRSLAATPETQILLEIVGAVGLSEKLKTSVDPYCVVKLGEKEVHRTKTIHNDANPIWSLTTKSLCIVVISDETTKRKNTAARAVFLDIDVYHGSKQLCRASLPLSALCEGEGDRREIHLQPAKGSTIVNGILALRYKKATHGDLVFLGISKRVKDIETSDDAITGSKNVSKSAWDINFRNGVKPNSLFQSNRRKQDGVTQIRVMPYPDPSRLGETEWMTREEIEQEALKPSSNWISAGYGNTGTVFLEVIGCDNLPNMDFNLNDLTDPFIGIVFEDNLLRTDVIWDDLSPRWMPWTTRAFCFKVRHPASLLMLGVFDYDDTPVDFHDPVGRVVINTANFYANTDYLLHYPLHHDPRNLAEESRGSIVVRLRIEWRDESEAMKMSFTKQPRFIVNVDNIKSYEVLKYLTRGAVDMGQSSMDSVKLYVKELKSYWQNYCFVLDVLMEIFLWRGRVKVGKNRSFWFPINSIVLLASVVSIIEHPHKVVPVLLYLFAWMMLSVNYYGSRHPYPWKRVKPSEETNMMMLFGKSITLKAPIEPGQGITEGAKIDKLDKLKAARMSALIQAMLAFALNVKSIYSKTSASYFQITTQTKDWSFVGSYLHYLHLVLKLLCTYIRLFRNLVNWRGYYADVLTTNCIILATIWMILPVNFVVLWLVRIFSWLLLGPWMKLVDIYYVHKWYKTQEELLEAIEKDEDGVEPDLPDFDALLSSEVILKMSHKGRVMAEDTLKLKEMREHMFGHYSEIVPAVDSSPIPSIPLTQSSAVPRSDASSSYRVECKHHVPGQRLHGTMILTQAKGDPQSRLIGEKNKTE